MTVSYDQATAMATTPVEEVEPSAARKYAVELIGAFFLSSRSRQCVQRQPARPAGLGASLMIMVYAVAHSGAHYNPAVTMAALVRGGSEYVTRSVTGSRRSSPACCRVIVRSVVTPATPVKTLSCPAQPGGRLWWSCCSPSPWRMSC